MEPLDGRIAPFFGGIERIEQGISGAYGRVVMEIQ